MNQCTYKLNGNDFVCNEDEELDEALQRMKSMKEQYFAIGNERLQIDKVKDVTKNLKIKNIREIAKAKE